MQLCRSASYPSGLCFATSNRSPYSGKRVPASPPPAISRSVATGQTLKNCMVKVQVTPVAKPLILDLFPGVSTVVEPRSV